MPYLPTDLNDSLSDKPLFILTGRNEMKIGKLGVSYYYFTKDNNYYFMVEKLSRLE